MSQSPRRRALCAVAVLAWSSGCALFQRPPALRALERDLAQADREAETVGVLFPGAAALDRAALVDAVLRRNPTIAAARHAWRAALARYPQETALDDPTVGYVAGPRSFDSPQIRRAQRIEASQAFPFPGKLSLRGAIALAEAEATAGDYAAVRLRLAAMASSLYDDYWLAERSIEVNDQHLALVRQLRDAATARYESGTAELQDPLQAEVEEAMLLHTQVELAAARRVTAQQILQLLHADAGTELPPAPAALEPVGVPADAAGSAERAIDDRPEVRAAKSRIEARRAAERLAKREFLPDFTLSGGYDTFWEIPDQRPFVGIEVEVPLAIGRRLAALDQARAETAQAQSEQASLRDEIATAVRTASESYTASQHGYEIVADRTLPASRDRLSAARAAFEAGRVDFRDLIEAERGLRNAELAERTALAETSRRAAALRAALGLMPADAPSAGAGGERHD